MHRKISIITPTLNQGKFIERSIRSVIDQNYPNLEYIIIDGGSTDETLSILRKYEKHITYWVSEKDSGQSNAINKGLKKASGEVINWLNSDDFLEEGALHRVNECFKNNSINVVAGYSTYVTDQGKEMPGMRFRTYIDKSNILSTLANTSLNQPSTFFKKNVFDKITPLLEEYHYNMDLIMWLKYLCLFGMNQIQLIDDELSVVTYHKNAKTVKDFEKTFPEKQRAYEALFNSFLEKKADLQFEISAVPKNKRTLNKLKRYYFRYRIFKRNLADKRVGFSLNNLMNYIIYSIKTIF